MGFIVYGLAAIFSATRDIAHWYQRVGDNIYYRIIDFGNENLIQLTQELNISLTRNGDRGIGWYFMDLVIEESMELIGAAALLSAVIAYYKFISQD